jgi:hypothetical protein
MMRAGYVCAVALAVVSLSAVAWADAACCGGNKDEACRVAMATTQPTTQPSEVYVCPMGCSTSDKPGKCPVCGMTMVKKDAKAAPHPHQD